MRSQGDFIEMADLQKFDVLRRFEADVLSEIVKEGEARLQAQLQIATAADQRALTFAGFQIASATGALAGGVALVSKDGPEFLLAALALGFAAFMLYCAYLALRTVRPAMFSIPGNRPNGWLPENWLASAGGDFSIKIARIEQAACIDEAIIDNDKIISRSAKTMHRSMDLTLRTVGISGFLFFITIVGQNWTIREPNSEIIRRVPHQHYGSR
jgi:hypothetical protein